MNKLWLIAGFTVLTFSSCITAAQFNNAEDDVYYSPKASNKKAPVFIPDVDVDEIIKNNPPQYGTPTNRIDDGTTNPYAAIGYPAYKARQDSLYRLYPELSGYYVDPDLTSAEDEEEARRFRRMYSGGSGYRSSGWGVNSWGPAISIGYSSGWGYGAYNNFYDPWYGYGYNRWGCSPGWNIGWNSGWGWNGCGGWGSSWNNPYYGYGYYGGWNSPGYWGGYPYYGNGWNNWSDNNGNNNGGGNNSRPIERPRSSVGSNTPPASGNAPVNRDPNGMRTNTEGTNPPATAQPKQYNPAPGSARLEEINGRQVYTPPANSQPAVRPNRSGSTPAQTTPPPSQRNYNGQQQNNQNSTPAGTSPAPSMRPSAPSSPPSGGGNRSVGGSNGGSRNTGGGGGGVQRPR